MERETWRKKGHRCLLCQTPLTREGRPREREDVTPQAAGSRPRGERHNRPGSEGAAAVQRGTELRSTRPVRPAGYQVPLGLHSGCMGSRAARQGRSGLLSHRGAGPTHHACLGPRGDVGAGPLGRARPLLTSVTAVTTPWAGQGGSALQGPTLPAGPQPSSRARPHAVPPSTQVLPNPPFQGGAPTDWSSRVLLRLPPTTTVNGAVGTVLRGESGCSVIVSWNKLLASN